MKLKGWSVLLCSVIIFLYYSCKSPQAVNAGIDKSDVYQCLPCGSDCDKTTYLSTGDCPHCRMKLVKQATITFRSIPSDSICNYIQNHPDAILLDVRTKNEFEGKANPDFGTLKNAINIPIQELQRKLNEIAHLKNKEILVFCSHSHRSPQASYFLTQNGFMHVTNMNGGMSEVNDSTCKK